jgi:uncharacterized membrane protein
MGFIRPRREAGTVSPPHRRAGRRGLAAIAAAAAAGLLFASLAVAVPPSASADDLAEAGAAEASPPVTLLGYLRDKRGRFTTVLPPGAAGTKLGDINNRGQIVGAYSDDKAVHSFVRDRGGGYTTFDFPGSPGTEVGLGDINDRGQIVGSYSDGAGIYRSFLRSRRGAFSGIQHPVASGTSPYGSGTVVYGINDRGVMVGAYAAGGTVHGFVRDANGSFTTVDYPGAAETALYEINERGQIVGSAGDTPGSGLPHDFVLDDGDYAPIEFPGASQSYVDDVNNRREIVGYYLDATGTLHGFLRDRRGRYSPIDHPGAVAPGNDTNGLNDRGQIVGEYYDHVDGGAQTSGLRHGRLGAAKTSLSLLPGPGLPAG